MKKIIYCTLLIFLISAHCFTFSADELLDEGRQAMNVINEYNRLKSLDVKTIYAQTFVKFFHPYKIETIYGKDDARLFFGGLDLIFNTTNHGRIVMIGQFFWLGSGDRKKVVDGEVQRVTYGYATDFYIGYDQVIFKYFQIHGGGIFSISKSNDIQPSGTLPGGGQAFKEMESNSDFKVDPVFGIQLFGFPLVQLGSTLSYSVEKKRISSSSTVLKLEFSKLIPNLGDVHVGYKTYSFFEDEDAFVFKWEKIYNHFAFGFEIFNKSNKIGEIFFEINLDILKFIKEIKNHGKRKKRTTKTIDNRTGPITTSEGEIKNTVKGRLTTILRQPIPRDTALFLYLRFNLARTPETEEILNSNSLLFGWKMGLKFTFLRNFTVEAYWLYNFYPELLMFKHSVDRHGMIFLFTFFY